MSNMRYEVVYMAFPIANHISLENEMTEGTTT